MRRDHAISGNKAELGFSTVSIIIIGPNTSGIALSKLVRFVSRRRCAEDAISVYVGHPIPEAKTRYSELSIVSRGMEQRILFTRHRNLPVVSPLMDLMLTVFGLVRPLRRYDICIGVSLHLGLVGLLLRSMGIVKRVIFWTIDYFPSKSGRQLIDCVYSKLDGLCASKADYFWDISPNILEARRKKGIPLREENRVIVPYMLQRDELNPLPIEQQEPDSLVWAGLVGPEYGFDLVIEALPLVVKERPTVKVTVMTYQEFPERLRRRIEIAGLKDHFRILGHVANSKEFSTILRRHKIGLAPYKPYPEAYKKYSDVSRPKVYMARGLPVIITRVPLIATDIEQEGSGIVINYDKNELAHAVLKLLSDQSFYERCRQNAVNLASKFDADNIFRNAFQRVGVALSSD